MFRTSDHKVVIDKKVVKSKLGNKRIYEQTRKEKKWSSQKEKKLEWIFCKEILDILYKKKIKTYVDYGCGDGRTANAIKKIHDSDTYCLDVNPINTLNYIENNSIDTIKKSFDNDSVDLVSVIQSLHHVPFIENNMIEVLNNIIDVISPGGLLLIREHDVQTVNDLNAVNTEHIIYSYTETDKGINYYDWLRNYNKNDTAWYFSKSMLHNIIKKRMTLLHTEPKTGKNLTKIYNSIYVKDNSLINKVMPLRHLSRKEIVENTGIEYNTIKSIEKKYGISFDNNHKDKNKNPFNRNGIRNLITTANYNKQITGGNINMTPLILLCTVSLYIIIIMILLYLFFNVFIYKESCKKMYMFD